MKILAIDTSSEKGMVALLEGTHQMDLQLCGVRLFGQQANPLMSEMEALFNELGLSVDDLGCIVVGIGPGSYTGIRVGAMVAKTLSFAKHIPLVGISSLLAWMPQKPGKFAVAVDAKVSGLYLLLGEITSDGNIVHEAPAVYPLQEALARLASVTRIDTPHQALIQKRLSSLGVDVNQWQWHEHAPNPEIMARFALKERERGGGAEAGKRGRRQGRGK